MFAEFYKELYTSTTKMQEHEHEQEDKYEQDAINQLRGNAANTRGVNAEMITNSTRKLNNTYFDCTTKPSNPTSNHQPNWRDTTIKVIYKSGDPASPSYYRPICSIPILYKLSSSSSGVYNSHWMPTSPLAKQASDCAPNHVSTAQTESRRVAPAGVGRSH